MKSLLVTAVIATFVLALFFHSGNAIVCYQCPVNNCDNQVTCTSPQDTCLTIFYGTRNESSCWKYSDCNTDALSKHFGTKNFRYDCCQRNLCNNAPNVVTSKIVLSGSLLLIVVHMLKSLV
ncbi:CD59 glycoprotein-like [Erythrolamprus reginae]|uniref:CD59 glycoprotein-like n=1 Tax=Erythrolamprus reginae TaxID=121349 RepID=UPI00396C9105